MDLRLPRIPSSSFFLAVYNEKMQFNEVEFAFRMRMFDPLVRGHDTRVNRVNLQREESGLDSPVRWSLGESVLHSLF